MLNYRKEMFDDLFKKRLISTMCHHSNNKSVYVYMRSCGDKYLRKQNFKIFGITLGTMCFLDLLEYVVK